MMGRKKRILIITLSIITVLILIIGGVLIYLNCATDTFKSTQELFYKYLYQNGDIADVFDTNLLDRYYQKIENNAYNGKGELTIKTGNTDGTESDTKQFDDFINKTKIEYNTKSNLTEKKAETEAKIIYDNKEQFKMNFARNDNNYAVKSDEVVYKYLLLRNENLREVYTKLGIENIDKIPNQFEKIDYNIYKDMKPEDKGRILSTYQNVLNKEILSNHYTKQKIPMQINGKEMKGNVYTLTLTEEELSSLKIKLLETLMTDELTLKYVVQFLQLDGSYTIKIKQAIQEEIDDLKREQIQDNGFIKIMVYECNMKLINTRIETKEYNYTIDNKYSEGNQKVELIKSSNDGNNIVTKINIERITSDAKNSFKIEQVSTTGETITDKNTLIIEIKGNIERDNLEVNVTLENLIGNKSNIINYNNKKEFTNNVEVVNLTNDNSVILNDMTLEEIDSLYKSVVSYNIGFVPTML